MARPLPASAAKDKSSACPPRRRPPPGTFSFIPRSGSDADNFRFSFGQCGVGAVPFGFVENDHETAILLASSLRSHRPWRARRRFRARGRGAIGAGAQSTAVLPAASESRPDVVPVRYRRCYGYGGCYGRSQLNYRYRRRRLALPPLSPLSPLLPALWAAALFRPGRPGLPLLRSSRAGTTASASARRMSPGAMIAGSPTGPGTTPISPVRPAQAVLVAI